MNILILNWRDPSNPKSGGAEIVTLEHAKAWVKNEHKVTWLSVRFSQSKEREDIEGVNIVRKGNTVTLYFFAVLYYLFSKTKFDIVVDEIHGLPFFTPLYVRKPKIAFIHEVADEIWDYMFPFPINKIGKMLEKFIFIPYRSISFMTVSNSTAKELRKFGINKVKVIENGIHFSQIQTEKKESIPTFIFVSRVVKMKGVEDVIKAFFNIIKEVKDAQLFIVGDGDKKYINFLTSEINTYSISQKVKFLGRVSEKRKLELMASSDLLLHASVKEGWGLVVIEAASQGTPAIVYNVPGLRDSVINGQTGIVLSKNSPIEMASEAIKLINDKSKYLKFQKKSIEWARSLTWEKSTKQSLELLEKLSK